MHDPIKELLRHVQGLWRYRWPGVIAGTLACVLGWIAIMFIPDTYEGKARFYVDSGTRLKEVVTNLGLEPEVSSLIYMVRQAVLSRPQLEKVAREHDMDHGARNDEDFERILVRLRESLSIEQGRGNEGQNLFDISYEGPNPEIAKSVVASLLSSFVEDVLSKKREDTHRAKDFLSDQLDYYRTLLSDTERKLEQFKRENPGFVVDDRGSFFDRLERSRENVETFTRELQVEEQKAAEIRRQLNNIVPFAITEDGGASYLPETSRRMTLIQQRDELLLQYTPEHPDVKALNEQIARVERLEQRALNDLRDNPDGAATATNPVYIEVQIALSEANVAVQEKRTMLRDAIARRERLESFVDTAPALERQFTQLTRDYREYQQFYDEVLQQSERERIARIGEAQDLVMFNIIDPPVSTQIPIAPKRGLLCFLSILLGLGIAASIMVVLNFLNRAVHDIYDIVAISDLPVLGSVSTHDAVTPIHQRLTPIAVYGLTFLGISAFVLLFSSELSYAIRAIVS